MKIEEAPVYQCLKCHKQFDELVTITYTEYAGGHPQHDWVSPCCRSARYEEIEQERPTMTVRCGCGNWVALLPLGQYDYTCGCGQRFNGAGQRLREYCCSLDEQGIDCGHGEACE